MDGYTFLLIFRRLILALTSIYMAFDSGPLYAYILKYESISNSYSNCHYRAINNTFTEVSATIDFKVGYTSSARYLKRAVLFYSYDKYGNAKNTSVASSVTINGVSYSNTFIGSNYFMYMFNATDAAFIANVVAVVETSKISAWPAVSIRAGAYTSGDDVAEITGGAYITFDRNGTGGNGTCRVVVDPGVPPALDASISVSAPDWDLGEIPQGVSDTLLNRTDQQLCFSYDAVDFRGKFIISASNANGVVNSRYLLRHLSDTSQAVPYSLMLDSGSARIQLPNNNAEISLDSSGRTCFVPTFKTDVGKTVKGGDYSDVLTFTVTTKS